MLLVVPHTETGSPSWLMVGVVRGSDCLLAVVCSHAAQADVCICSFSNKTCSEQGESLLTSINQQLIILFPLTLSNDVSHCMGTQ